MNKDSAFDIARHILDRLFMIFIALVIGYQYGSDTGFFAGLDAGEQLPVQCPFCSAERYAIDFEPITDQEIFDTYGQTHTLDPFEPNR